MTFLPNWCEQKFHHVFYFLFASSYIVISLFLALKWTSHRVVGKANQLQPKTRLRTEWYNIGSHSFLSSVIFFYVTLTVNTEHHPVSGHSTIFTKEIKAMYCVKFSAAFHTSSYLSFNNEWHSFCTLWTLFRRGWINFAMVHRPTSLLSG